MIYVYATCGFLRCLFSLRLPFLRLASFERTTDLVFDAAARHRVDPIKGVSECLGYNAAAWVRSYA